MKKITGFLALFIILLTGVWAAEDIQVVLEQPAFSSADSGKVLKYNLIVTLPDAYVDKFSSFSVTVLMDKSLGVTDTSLISQKEVKGKVDVRTTSISGKDQNIVTLNVNDLSEIKDKRINLEITTKVKKDISSSNNLKNSFVLSYVDKKGNPTSDQKNLESSTKTQNGTLSIKDVYTNSKEIVGITEKNAKVRLAVDSKFYKETNADENGNFKIAINDLKEGTLLHFVSTTKNTSATLDYLIKPAEDSYKASDLVTEENNDKDLYKTIKSLYKLQDLVNFSKDIPTVKATVQNEKRLKAAIASSEYVIVKDEVSSKEIDECTKELDSAIKEVRLPYMSGISETKFSPDKKMTRAESASVLKRIIAPNKIANDFSSFSDIKSDAWYNDDIVFIEKEGLIKGYEDGTFKPNREMTRAQFAALIAGYLKLDDKGDGIKFKDVKDNHWAKKYIDMLSANGIMVGKSENEFFPEKKISRAEAATIFNKILNRNINKSFIDKYSKNPYKDLDKDHWAYYQIIEITAN